MKRIMILTALLALYVCTTGNAQINIGTGEPYDVVDYARGDKIAKGSIVTVLESNLVHVDTSGVADGLVNKGDACLISTGLTSSVLGGIPGVSMMSADAATDYVTVETEGIFALHVTGVTSLVFGQEVYINPSTGVLSDTGTIANDGSELLVQYGTYLDEDALTTTASTLVPIRLSQD